MPARGEAVRLGFICTPGARHAFDITNLPNGTCYLEVFVNPEHVQRETSNANDVSLRKIIISGKSGYRNVFVPRVFRRRLRGE